MLYDAEWVNNEFHPSDHTSYLFEITYEDDDGSWRVCWSGYLPQGISRDGNASLIRAVDLLSFTDVTDREQERILCQHSAHRNS